MARTITGFDTIDSGTTAGMKIKGRTDGPAGTAGYVGEKVESFVANGTARGTAGQYSDITSVSLTAGVWLVSAVVRYDGGTTEVGLFGPGIGSNSGNSAPNYPTGVSTGSQGVFFDAAKVLTGGSAATIGVPATFITLSTTTTVYLKTLNSTPTGGTPVLVGRITAVRIA